MDPVINLAHCRLFGLLLIYIISFSKFTIMRQELILEIIKERWSPYSFASAEVEEYKLKSMFEAAGCAPSCNNEQPWLFVYATNKEPEIFEDYLGFLNESNRIWVKNAYAIVISMARLNFTHGGKPNRHAFHDTGMAVSNLLQQALSLDVYVHQMAGFSVEKVKEYFNLSVDIEPVAMMAVGYLGDGSSLSPELMKRDEKRRSRRSVEEYTFRDFLSIHAFKNV
jgi:nitroreductase